MQKTRQNGNGILIVREQTGLFLLPVVIDRLVRGAADSVRLLFTRWRRQTTKIPANNNGGHV